MDSAHNFAVIVIIILEKIIIINNLIKLPAVYFHSQIFE